MKYWFLFMLCLSTMARADVYRWTDENGKVHFGDTPPRNVKAENISHATRPVNTDESSEERKKVGNIFAPKTPEEERYEQQQAQGLTQEKQSRAAACEKLAKELTFFQTERFYWIDADGNEQNATEEERRQAIENIQAAIKANCS